MSIRKFLAVGTLLLLTQGSAFVRAEVPQADSAFLATCRLPLNSLAWNMVDAISPFFGVHMLDLAAPASSSRLETLDIVRVGISIDVYRQGQIWAQLQQQNAKQAEVLHVGTALEMDPAFYPTIAEDKDMAWSQRKANALEMALRSFPERWPIPTLTVVRNYDPTLALLTSTPDDVSVWLNGMTDRTMGPAGLHWHLSRPLKPGVVCNSTPEEFVEYLFRVFEARPDMPALLVYAVDGYAMHSALGTRDDKPIGLASGPRQPGELTDAVTAIVFARPERLDWLRGFAKYTKPHKNDIDPAFTGWRRNPPYSFQPSPWFPQPITERGFQQWDRLTPLARLHRPVEVSLQSDGIPLKGEARHAAIANAWTQAVTPLAHAPARVFYDAGLNRSALADLLPALQLAGSPLDLLASDQSYDLTQRLGDTGAASPFVGIALATMASYLNADTSAIVPLRRDDRVTVITISSPTPGQKPANDPFGVKLRPQTRTLSEAPSPEFLQRFAELTQESRRNAPPPARYVDPEKIAAEQRLLDQFIAGGPSMDLLGDTEK
ncbi:type VI lipase adapter Tla3 domain-containing protein [Achromobacter sp. AGC78]